MSLNFPKNCYLTYIPTNYQVWVKVLMEYGAHEYALAMALLDESKLNFNYVVSDLPMALLQDDRTSLSMRSLEGWPDSLVSEGSWDCMDREVLSS